MTTPNLAHATAQYILAEYSRLGRLDVTSVESIVAGALNRAPSDRDETAWRDGWVACWVAAHPLPYRVDLLQGWGE